MDLDHLKQWTEQKQESDLTRPLVNDCYYYQQHHSNCSELPLFDQKLNLHDSSSRMRGNYFSIGQWQEFEVQACIYRHIIVGAPVPPQLLHLVNNTLIHSSSPPPFYPYHTALLQSWGRGGMDPEPGRCRRTDGKKWRCSRDVVSGYKYCERHMHRGRNRSRKPVEIPIPPSNQSSHSFDLLHLNQRPSQTVTEAAKGLYRTPKNELPEDDKSGGQVLRPFFDDWSRSVEESKNSINNGGTCLSISVPGNTSSDFSLKLSTGGGNPGPEVNVEREQSQLQWDSSASSWGTNQMGGPLAEALRSSSTSTSSPTSVLHQRPGSAPNFIST